MKDYDKALFKTLEQRGKTASDYQFVKKLAKWIANVSGNVNVTMRLELLAEKLK